MGIWTAFLIFVMMVGCSTHPPRSHEATDHRTMNAYADYLRGEVAAGRLTFDQAIDRLTAYHQQQMSLGSRWIYSGGYEPSENGEATPSPRYPVTPSSPTTILPLGRGYSYDGPGGSGTILPLGRGYSINPNDGSPPTTCLPMGQGMSCQ